MRLIWKSFRSLYFATLLMLLGSGLLSTYLALRLADTVDGLWVGALMAANYFGLVLGGKLGHRLIGRVDLWRKGGELVINRIFPETGVPRRSVEARAKAAAGTLSRQLGVGLRLP